jgi:cephalosporin hydroxylase
MAELVHPVKPDAFIEAGTYHGGSALFFSNLFDLMGRGRLITSNINYPDRPRHWRMTFMLGSSTSTETAERIKSLIRPFRQNRVTIETRLFNDQVAADGNQPGVHL